MLPRGELTRYAARVEIRLTNALLRPWRMDDAAALVACANNRNISRNLRDRFPFPYTAAHAEAYLTHKTEVQSDLVFCIDIDGAAAGGIGVHPSDDVYRLTAELGYWLAEPFWGRGIVTEAVQAVVRQGFNLLPLVRIEASAFASNPASARVLEKCGFTFEGVRRHSVIKDGQILDLLGYSILREECLPQDHRKQTISAPPSA
ncbi:MAG: GNAT family N-acetyltransferase [Chthoniobacterales bacterium]